MLFVILVLTLVLLQYTYVSFQVGQQRLKHDIKAPAITGHPEFERMFRVQQNTLELLVIYIPGLFLFATYVHDLSAAAVGAVFLVGRHLYCQSYCKDPQSRGVGFLMSFASAQVLLLGGMIGAVIRYI